MRHSLTEIPSLWTEAWFSEFLRSAGFGGVAAVLAATVGLIGVWRRSQLDRRLARDSRAAVVEDNAADRWWSMYQWSLAQLGTLDAERALVLLTELDSQAPGPAERALVSVAIDLYLEEV